MSLGIESQCRIFRAFSDEGRLKILDLLRSGEQSVGAIGEELGLAQSTLSYHLKILCASGVVESRPEGKWTYYRISPEGSRKAQAILQEALACPGDQ